jgi:hypothetical protein
MSTIIGLDNWFTKRVKGERPLLTNSGYKIIAKFITIIPKAEK